MRGVTDESKGTKRTQFQSSRSEEGTALQYFDVPEFQSSQGEEVRPTIAASLRVVNAPRWALVLGELARERRRLRGLSRQAAHEEGARLAVARDMRHQLAASEYMQIKASGRVKDRLASLAPCWAALGVTVPEGV
jgi:hypothetical protein